MFLSTVVETGVPSIKQLGEDVVEFPVRELIIGEKRQSLEKSDKSQKVGGLTKKKDLKRRPKV